MQIESLGSFTLREIEEILLSVFVLGFAFMMVLLEGPSIPGFLVSTFLVFISFIPHELAHRTSARSLNCYAVYKIWPSGLLLALLSSFLGFVFAAPGAIRLSSNYYDRWGREMIDLRVHQIGMIALSGPLLNLMFGLVFLALPFTIKVMGYNVLRIGAYINIVLALVNLIPIGSLDGKKILMWEVTLWAFLFGTSLITFVLFFL